MGRAVKNSLEIIIKQVRLEGGFERGGSIRVAECLRQSMSLIKPEHLFTIAFIRTEFFFFSFFSSLLISRPRKEVVLI